MKRKKGKVASWNDEKGFGFISAAAGGDRIFVHIKAFKNLTRRPLAGDIVSYSVSADSRGRRCAKAVCIAGTKKNFKPRRLFKGLSYVIAAGFLLVVTGAVLISAIPAQILLIYLIVSSATFAVYALDKSAAESGGWRTSEGTLHLLALSGGWPGALIAQRRLRHKSRKQPFRSVYWITVIINCAAFIWLLTPEGAAKWRSVIALIA